MSTPTLDGMTVAQLDDIIARATATKAAAVKAEESKDWREFKPEEGYSDYRIHVKTREVQMRGDNGWVESPVFSATMESISINRTRKRYIVSALTALGSND